MRVRLAKGATILGSVATRLGEAGVDISRLQTRRKDERHVALDLLLDVPAGQPLDLLLERCQDLDGVEVEQVISYPAGADLHEDLELVQRLERCAADLAPQVLATAAPLLCGATWAALVDPEDGEVTYRTTRAPELQPSDLEALGRLRETHPVELRRGCPSGGPPAQLAVVALPAGGTLLVARRGRSPFSAAELARLEHLGAVAAGTERTRQLGVPPRPDQD